MTQMVQVDNSFIPAQYVRTYVDGKRVAKIAVVKTKVPPNKGKGMTEEQKLDKLEARLRKFIGSGNFSVADMAEKMRRNKTTADEYMRDLYRDGRLLKSHETRLNEGSKPTQFYKWPE